MFGKGWKKECAWDGCSRLTETQYCRAHERVQGDAFAEEAMRMGRMGASRAQKVDGELSCDEVLHFVWESCAGQQQEIQRAVPQLNSWLSDGMGIAVYRHDDVRIEPVLAHQLVSFGTSEAFISDAEPPSTFDTISFFDGPYTLVGTYRGGPLW